MKVILYMAISVNGNITRGKSDSNWVDKADWKIFNKVVTDSKVMVMGSETYKQFADDFPYKGALNVVLTTKPDLLKKKINGALFTSISPKEIVEKLSDDGFKKIAVIGGMRLNTSFIKANLVDEIYVDIHPYLIGKGLRLFGDIENFFKSLKLVDIKQMKNDLVLLHYQVIK